MLLAKFPRRRYTHAPTPIEKLENLTKLLDGPNIYIKRDDLLGLSGGGNKTRKLEFIVADALEQGADTLITCGAVQSNHCRLTLSAAVKEGLTCQFVLEERVKDSYNKEDNGNNFLYNLLGAEKIKVVDGGSDMNEAMAELAKAAVAAGKKPYIIPGGGSNALGSLGYVACAQEISEQTFESGTRIDHIVTASGSGGTHAGLVAGFQGTNANIDVLGINVSRPNETQAPNIHKLAQETAEFLELQNEISSKSIICYDEYVGGGYAIHTEGMVEAVKMLAKTEGILLDQVYTGKAMAGFIDLIRKGTFKKTDNVLFVHTGGSPSLYAEPKLFD